MTYRPLFVTGMARSGSNLLSRMLSANPDAMVACDPFFPLFTSLRNAMVRRGDKSGLVQAFDPASPIQDYYFDDERIRLMDIIQAGELSLPYDRLEWQSLCEGSTSRMSHECADLIPHLSSLLGPTYRDMLDNGLRIIAGAREAMGRRWVGFKEVWTIEFFAPLARAYPEARFIVLLRDPRAVLASMHAIDRLDATQVAHTLSYARHWRKYVAFATHYGNDPTFANRLLVVTYERLVAELEKTARALCDFLEIAYDVAMLDAEAYYDFSRGTFWRGNSSFETELTGISVRPLEGWRTHLDACAVELAEFVCGPEMVLAGYCPVTPAGEHWPSAAPLDYLVQNGREPCSWRSDFGDPQRDWGFELFRRTLLELDERSLDRDLVRRSFLFEDVFTRLRRQCAAA